VIAVTRAQARDLDRRASEEFGIPAAVLMENAGRAAADEVMQAFRPRSATVVCGTGNNGGDGLVVARRLAEAGVQVRCYKASAANPAEAQWGDVTVDALFGTGLSRPVEGPMRAWIEAMNAHAPVVAVDIPSGLDADTGKPLGVAVRAAVTVTFGWAKVGMLEPDAAPYVGRLVVADIGYPDTLGP
jgi:NAD(P)H-hydrate repair Nnr-like enzyme with NAD(P)H-hydrate epimerase domain